MAFFDATITAHTIAAKMKGNGSDSIYVSSAQRQRFGGVNAFYEKVIKVKADVAAFLINCFSSA